MAIGPSTRTGSADGASLAAIVGSRLLANAVIRIPYVFLAAFSSGLALPVPAMTAILGLRELGGVASLGIGRWADHGNERRSVVACGFAAGLTTLAAGFFTGPTAFAIVMAGNGVFLFGAGAAQSSWVAHRVAFGRRSRVLGITELTWGGAFLLGAPLCAWLIEVGGWRLPFRVLGVALLIGAAVLWHTLEPDATPDRRDAPTPWRALLRTGRRSWGVVGFNVAQPFSQMLVFAVAGDWFVEHLGMSLSGLGANTVLVGAGEILGTLGTVAFADRIGPARAGILGMALVVPTTAALGLVGGNAALGVALLVVTAVGMEFGFVSAFPLLTEIAPDSRAAAIGGGIALMTISRAVAAATAGWLYATAGIGVSGICAAMISAVAAWCLWRGGAVEPGSTDAVSPNRSRSGRTPFERPR